MSKTLLHVLFGGQRGGCETNALEIIRALPGIKHRVVILGNGGPMCEMWRKAGATVEVCGTRANAFLGVVPAMRKVIAREVPDAAMIWHGLVQLPQLIHVLNPLNIPIGVHGGNPAYSMVNSTNWKFSILEKIYPPRGPLPTYICCSQYVADSFKASRYLRRFPRTVAYNGVKQPISPTHTPRQLNADDAPVIGMLARLSSIKDHSTLIRAMPIIRKRYPNAILELAGDGDLRESLEQLAVELGIVAAIRFLGDVSDVYAVMKRWDLFAYTTTEREGLGNALAEAMMFGLPCIVTDVGPMREFGANKNAIQLVSARSPKCLSEAIVASLADLSSRECMCRDSKEFAAERFGAKSYAEQHQQILNLSEDLPKANSNCRQNLESSS